MSTTLFRQEPHYIPGYTGYCPQKNFKMANTYGRTTHDILTDSSITKSKKRVLADNELPSEQASRIDEYVLPGYTGYVPRKENRFGMRYAVTCEKAFKDLESDKLEYAKHLNERMQVVQSKPQVAIKSENGNNCLYNEESKLLKQNSPYFMKSDDPGKVFKTGYTGYVPQARYLYSNVFATQTKSALNEFTEAATDRELYRSKSDLNEVLSAYQARQVGTIPSFYKSRRRENTSNSIYRANQNLIPKYTGYLPGHKYRYGMSYGESAKCYYR